MVMAGVPLGSHCVNLQPTFSTRSSTTVPPPSRGSTRHWPPTRCMRSRMTRRPFRFPLVCTWGSVIPIPLSLISTHRSVACQHPAKHLHRHQRRPHRRKSQRRHQRPINGARTQCKHFLRPARCVRRLLRNRRRQRCRVQRHHFHTSRAGSRTGIAGPPRHRRHRPAGPAASGNLVLASPTPSRLNKPRG